MTPTARPLSTSIFSVCAFRRTVRFLRSLAGLRKALDAEDRSRVPGRQLIVADAVLHRAVEIVVERDARLLRRAQEGEADRRRIDRIGNAERPAVAVIGVDEALVVLAADEIGQNLAIAPALAAGLADPRVVILGVAARVELRVDRGAAADHLGLRVPDDAAVEMLLRDRAPAPARDALGHLGEARRHAEQRIPVAAARFEQQDLDRRVGAQPICEHAAGGAAADDDVVVGHRLAFRQRSFLDDVVGDAQRLRGDGQRRIDGGRRRQEGGVDDEQVRVVPGAAEGIERRRRRVEPDANGAALMRRRPAVEGSRRGRSDSRRRAALPEAATSISCGRPIAALPVEPDPRRRRPSPGSPDSGRSSLIAYQSTERLLIRSSAHSGARRRLALRIGAGDAPEELDVAERRPAAPVVEVEVVDAERLLIDRVVDDARVDGEHRRSVVVHEMPADRVGAVGEAAARADSSSNAAELTAPAASTTIFATIVLRLAAADDLDPGDALAAVGLDQQPLDAGVGAKLDVRMGERFFEAAALRVHLAVPGVGKCVPRRFRALQPFVDVDAERQRERVQA